MTFPNITKAFPVLPRWALASTNYPAGSESWANTPRIVQPTQAEIEAGYKPGDQFPAQLENWLKDQFGQVISAMMDLQAFNFHKPSSTATNIGAENFTASDMKICIGPDGAAVSGGSSDHAIFILSNTPAVFKSRDGLAWATTGALGFSPTIITSRWAGMHQSAGANVVVIDGAGNANSRTTDGGATWTSNGTLPSSGSWQTANWWHGNSLNQWICAGTNKLATAGINFSGGWTSRTVQHANGYNKIVTAKDDVGVPTEALLLSNASTTQITKMKTDFSTSLVTVASSAKTFTDGCWSPYWGRFYLITSDGHLYYSATADGPWTHGYFETDISPSTLEPTRIYAFGRALLAFGQTADLDTNTLFVSINGGLTWANVSVWETGIASPAWFWCGQFKGRAVLARIVSSKLETCFGLVTPAEMRFQ